MSEHEVELRLGTLPNEACRRCGGENVTWFAPSPLWNSVMRGNDINGDPLHGDLVCLRCFVVLAEAAGIKGRWRLTADPEPEGLIYETPSGRTWDAEKWQWVDGEDDERFCPNCFAGITSDQHREACELGRGPHPGLNRVACGDAWGEMTCTLLKGHKGMHIDERVFGEVKPSYADLAARLADAEARAEAALRLADEWDRAALEPDRPLVSARTMDLCAHKLREALRGDQ